MLKKTVTLKPKDFGKNAEPRMDKKKMLRLGVYFLLIGLALHFVISHWGDFAAMFLEDKDDPIVGALEPGDYFFEFKLEREKMRKEQIDLVKSVIDDERADKDVRKAAYGQYLGLADVMGKELQAEGILNAKGLDAIVFLSADSCTVVVNCETLSQKDVAQIGDVMRRVSKIKLENMTVIPCPK